MVNGTVILGLDGGNWELLDRWIGEGKLSNIDSLRSKGAWGDHMSELPPTTFPNWKCYSTGRDPGQLGVYWFEMINLDEKELSIPNSTDFQGRELWDYLNDYGIDVGVINMPTMFPPKSIDGFTICGGPGTTNSVYREIGTGYTYPESLENNLEERGYNVHPKPLMASRDDKEAIDAIHEIIDERFDLLEDKIEDADVIHMTLFYLNVLQHFFWDEEPTEEAWKIIDERIGELKEICDENGYNLVLMSDHGCEEIQTKFYINRWLEQEGYYVREKSTDDFLRKIGFNRENLLSIAKKLRLEKMIKLVPDSLQQLIPHQEGAVRSRKLDIADWDDSVAVASGQGPVYLDLERGTEKYEQVREEIIEELENLESPYTGKPVLEEVHKAEELYEELNGPAPDLVVSQNRGVTVSDRVGEGELFTKPDNWRAENKQKGMFVFYGPDFESSSRVEDFQIIDLAPTIFHAITDERIDVKGDSWDVLCTENKKYLEKKSGEIEDIDL